MDHDLILFIKLSLSQLQSEINFSSQLPLLHSIGKIHILLEMVCLFIFRQVLLPKIVRIVHSFDHLLLRIQQDSFVYYLLKPNAMILAPKCMHMK